MKIVINADYGGFSLSREALQKLREMGNEYALKETDVGEFYDDGSGPREDSTSFLRDIPRSHPDLISIVKEMGDKANGGHAHLVIVEIPDDVEWQVEEYDGSEWIAEKHRTWPV